MKSLKIIIFTALILFFIPALTISAAGGGQTRECSGDPYEIPSECKDDFIIDAKCQSLKILSPQSELAQKCCIHICKGDTSTAEDPKNTLNQEDLAFLNVFGVKLGLDFSAENRTKTISTLINLVITTILGIFSFYALFRGVYLAAVKRPVLTKPEDISKLNKEFTSLLIGFVIAWGVIFIVQLVFSILGLGSLTNFSFENAQNGVVITIK